MMTKLDEQPEIIGKPTWDREAILRSLSLFVVLLALIMLPILAHGCHRGDDIDLEPGTAPVENRR